MSNLKKIVQKVPIIGNLIIKIYQKIKGKKAFTTSENYWEDRYKAGGNSGAGSYNNLATFKAEVINAFVKENQVDSIIEFGCGDGNQLKYFEFPSYIGYDVSQTVINNCRKMYASDSTKKFELVKDFKNDKADLVLSLDVIYHLIEESTFNDYLLNLFTASKKYVIVYSTNEDNHPNNSVSDHVKHRNFTNWVEKHFPQFKLIKHIPNKYPFNGNNEISSYADFYIFESH